MHSISRWLGINKVKHVLKTLQMYHVVKTANITFSQTGEDVIIRHIFDCLEIARVSYLDVGAHHPTYLSNTYLFYKNGSSGICVEPDPTLFKEIKRKRGRDKCLNVGAGAIDGGKLEFFVMSNPALNTFSKEEAEKLQSSGDFKTEQIISVEIVSINKIIEQNFVQCPDFMSVDVEGMDLEIIESLDLTRFRPKVICVETITYSVDRSSKKLPEIAQIMIRNGYFVYADTYHNTIFVDNEVWASA